MNVPSCANAFETQNEVDVKDFRKEIIDLQEQLNDVSKKMVKYQEELGL